MKIDVIIPSLSSPELQPMVRDCISSLRRSEQRIDFNIILVESWAECRQFGQNSTIKYDRPSFNFHHAINLGLEKCTADWVVIANNDLIFKLRWMSQILAAAAQLPDVSSFSPWDPRSHNRMFSGESLWHLGYDVAAHIAGWCLVAKRSIFDRVKLSEEVEYWYSDNVYADELKKYGIKHALIRNSVVVHLCERTTNKLRNRTQMTVGQRANYEKIKGIGV